MWLTALCLLPLWCNRYPKHLTLKVVRTLVYRYSISENFAEAKHFLPSRSLRFHAEQSVFGEDKETHLGTYILSSWPTAADSGLPTLYEMLSCNLDDDSILWCEHIHILIHCLVFPPIITRDLLIPRQPVSMTRFFFCSILYLWLWWQIQNLSITKHILKFFTIVQYSMS